MRVRPWVAVAALLTVAAVAFVRIELLTPVTVSSDSMAPTVCQGDLLMLARLSEGDGVQVGDIVTFASPQDGMPTIKRVVAVGGQTVSIEDSELIIDGQRIEESYVDHASIDGVYTGRVRVPIGDVFVLGDRRETSIDSRVFGPIPADVIDGRLLWTLRSRCPSP